MIWPVGQPVTVTCWSLCAEGLGWELQWLMREVLGWEWGWGCEGSGWELGWLCEGSRWELWEVLGWLCQG